MAARFVTTFLVVVIALSLLAGVFVWGYGLALSARDGVAVADGVPVPFTGGPEVFNVAAYDGL